MKKGILNLIDLHTAREQISAFSECTGLGIEFLDNTGQRIEGYDHPLCPLASLKLTTEGTCETFCKKACAYAAAQNDAHVFMCPISVTRIACVVKRRKSVLGVLLTSPFLMNAPDPTILQKKDFFDVREPDALIDIYDTVIHLPVIAASQVHHRSRMLECIAKSIQLDKQDDERHEQDQRIQQAFINRTIQQYKENQSEYDAFYPQMKEKAILERFVSGDIDGAEQLMNEVLAAICVSQPQSIENIRDRAIELGVLISRASMENGMPSDLAFEMNGDLFSELRAAENFTTVCDILREFLKAQGRALIQLHKSPGSDIARRAVQIVYEHFEQAITLENTAEKLGVSHYYLSRVFKNCVGMGFRDFVNHVRIEQSKLLLRRTDMTLVEIAISVGFNDQSYFSKVFKRTVGVTPKQYR